MLNINIKIIYLIILIVILNLTWLYTEFFLNKNPNIFFNTNNKIYNKNDFKLKINDLTEKDFYFIYNQKDREYYYLNNIGFKKNKNNYILFIKYYNFDSLNPDNFYLIKNNSNNYTLYILNNKRFTLLDLNYLLFTKKYIGNPIIKDLEINFKEILKPNDTVTIFYKDRILNTFILDDK